jgi:hypothetical protein
MKNLSAELEIMNQQLNRIGTTAIDANSKASKAVQLANQKSPTRRNSVEGAFGQQRRVHQGNGRQTSNTRIANHRKKHNNAAA